MQQYTRTAPPLPPAFIYTGTSAERIAIQAPVVTSQFWETDTGLGYTFTGLAWVNNYVNGIPLYEQAP